MSTKFQFWPWFVSHWMHAAVPLAVVLLVLSPFIYAGTGWFGLLVYLTLPIYMLHQYEEHAEGQFARYVNGIIAQGRLLMTESAVLWINIVLVWALTLAVLYLTHYVNLAFGLVAAYMLLLNGGGHILMAVGRREYNPGAWSSLLLFVPFSTFMLWQYTQAGVATLPDHLLAIVAVILAHAAIILFVVRRLPQLRNAAPEPK